MQPTQKLTNSPFGHSETKILDRLKIHSRSKTNINTPPFCHKGTKGKTKYEKDHSNKILLLDVSTGQGLIEYIKSTDKNLLKSKTIGK
jgi:hypothetical protein